MQTLIFQRWSSIDFVWGCWWCRSEWSKSATCFRRRSDVQVSRAGLTSRRCGQLAKSSKGMHNVTESWLWSIDIEPSYRKSSVSSSESRPEDLSWGTILRTTLTICVTDDQLRWTGVLEFRIDILTMLQELHHRLGHQQRHLYQRWIHSRSIGSIRQSWETKRHLLLRLHRSRIQCM